MPGNNNGENKIVFEISYDSLGKFITRNNRFLGEVLIDGKKTYGHIHDPGRLEELLKKGNDILLKRYDKKNRKTEWEVIAARYGKNWIFINSKFHSSITRKILENSEINVGGSRLDFLLMRKNEKIWVEVKGCTLMIDHIALFPDAPTERGRRHVEKLIKLRKEGNRSVLIFLVFHNAKCFSPNKERDEKFANIFY